MDGHGTATPIHQHLEDDLQEALGHLYDPLFEPTPALRAALSCGDGSWMTTAQPFLLRALDGLRPGEDVPQSTRGWRMYRIMQLRYVEQLTQDEAAEVLDMSPRHLRREQRNAVGLLLERISAGGVDGQASALPGAGQTGQWRSWVQREMSTLRHDVTEGMADLAEMVGQAMTHTRPLATHRGISLLARDLPSHLQVALPPSALRQILVSGISEIARHMAGGQIAIVVSQHADLAQVRLAGCPAVLSNDSQAYLITELAATFGGECRLVEAADTLTCLFVLPLAARSTVFVVEDNQDLIHFYQRYVRSTLFDIVLPDKHHDLLEQVAQAAPDIVVLDILMAGVDGWELLVHLHDHPDTRNIPVIVCSVARERELAEALGAALYLPKPVDRAEFLRALSAVASRVPPATRSSSENNTTAC